MFETELPPLPKGLPGSGTETMVGRNSSAARDTGKGGPVSRSEGGKGGPLSLSDGGLQQSHSEGYRERRTAVAIFLYL